MKYKFWIGIILIMLHADILAQENQPTEVLQKAAGEYNIGRFGIVFDLLKTDITQWSIDEKVQAYRLLALSYLACDKLDDCRIAIRSMLETEPYYTPALQDPFRFVQLVKEMQSGKVTLVTASQQAESLEEAPVPVTLITQEMIQAAGARTLKDALITYVPGMTLVESPDEVNVAMHGIYSSAQQKILILLNGHRLNSRSYNAANPDFSISLDKVRQIEVLRGPSSSLYGNVALTAVVNIITWNGADINGADISVSFGNYGQKQANLLLGKRFLNTDLLAWGNVYYARGEKIFIPFTKSAGQFPHDGYTVLGAYRDRPAYDWGLTYNWNRFSLLFSQRYCKKNSLTALYGDTYDYSRYRKIDGEGVGNGYASTHAEGSYKRTFGKYTFDLSAYMDWTTHNLFSAAGDTIRYGGSKMEGAFQEIRWREFTWGASVRLNAAYKALGGSGNWLAGVQIEQMKINNVVTMMGQQYDSVYWHFPPSMNVLKTGTETGLSAFVQIKHYFTPSLILNAGLRFDEKIRNTREKITAFSPRISLVYLPRNGWSIKACYSRSFVDAPYFYRNNNSTSFKGAAELKPELMDAVQVMGAYHPPGKALYGNINLFYNHLTDFIYRMKEATGNALRYQNAGRLDIAGIEGVAGYIRPKYRADFNFTWQQVLSGENFDFRGARVYNIPSFVSHLILSGNVWQHTKHLLRLNIGLDYAGRQLAPIKNIQIGGRLIVDPDYMVNARVTVNTGIRYTYGTFEVAGRCYNLFNCHYEQGGTTILPHRQPGRWFLFEFKYRFHS